MHRLNGPSGQSGPVVDEPWREGESCAHQIQASRTGKNCPVCRQTLPDVEIRALSAEQSVAALPASCPHCDEAMNRGQLRRHELICPRAPATCVSEARRLLRFGPSVHSLVRAFGAFVHSFGAFVRLFIGATSRHASGRDRKRIEPSTSRRASGVRRAFFFSFSFPCTLFSPVSVRE